MSSGDKKRQVNATEKQLAKELGIWAQPASGATDGLKGDLRDVENEILFDVKTTDGKSVAVTLQMLQKINREAREAGLDPSILLHFYNAGKLIPNSWVLLPIDKYKELTGE